MTPGEKVLCSPHFNNLHCEMSALAAGEIDAAIRAAADRIVLAAAKAVVEAVVEEREACAKIAQQAWDDDSGHVRQITNAAPLIRARQ